MTQAKNKTEFVDRWTEHLNDFDRLRLSFDGSYDEYKAFERDLEKAKEKMLVIIKQVSKNVMGDAE